MFGVEAHAHLVACVYETTSAAGQLQSAKCRFARGCIRHVSQRPLWPRQRRTRIAEMGLGSFLGVGLPSVKEHAGQILVGNQPAASEGGQYSLQWKFAKDTAICTSWNTKLKRLCTQIQLAGACMLLPSTGQSAGVHRCSPVSPCVPWLHMSRHGQRWRVNMEWEGGKRVTTEIAAAVGRQRRGVTRACTSC